MTNLTVNLQSDLSDFHVLHADQKEGTARACVENIALCTRYPQFKKIMCTCMYMYYVYLCMHSIESYFNFHSMFFLHVMQSSIWWEGLGHPKHRVVERVSSWARDFLQVYTFCRYMYHVTLITREVQNTMGELSHTPHT